MEKISASLVLYNNDLTTVMKAAQSFLGSPMAGRLFIIDNSPSDSARTHFSDPRVTYIFSGKNLGYGTAHNLAMRQCLDTSTYHLVLNPDVYFESDVLEKLYYFMEEHPQAGLAMPKVLYPDGTLQHLCKLLPTPFNLATRRFVPFSHHLLRRFNDVYEMNFSQYNKVMNVPFLSGCFMFMRTHALKNVGLFDERFFLYAEDADLSRRIHQHHKTLFYPYAQIYHTHARGSYKNLRLTWCNLLSAVQYFNKWGWLVDDNRTTANQIALQQFTSSSHFEPIILHSNSLPQQSVNE